MNSLKFCAHVVNKLSRSTRLDRLMSDKCYLSVFYRMMTGEKMHWNAPLTFTEKMQWLKLYQRNEKMVMMADKVAVKEYVANLIGRQYVIPLLGGVKLGKERKIFAWTNSPNSLF